MEQKQQPSILQQLNKVRIKEMLQYCQIKPQTIEKLPEVFLQFMREKGLDVNQLTVPIPRYIRLKPKLEITQEELAAKLEINVKEIVKIDESFWAINPECKINKCSLYEESMLYGMDYSSSIPPRCLQLAPGMRVLELCSAPGNKSMFMADLYENITIKGVQISNNRANIMKSLIKKYNLQKQIEVIVQDGLKYDSEQLFDRVLVDAECTHEGSLKHIYKFFQGEKQSKEQIKANKKLTKQQEKQYKYNNSNPYTSEINKTNTWSKQDFQQRFLDAYKLSKLKELQYGMLQNGFRLLKPGGIIVYSTCSFDYQQNEDIIDQFIKKHEDAELLDASAGLNCGVAWKEGKIKQTLRFTPSISQCGGMFIGKLKKKVTQPDVPN